MDQSVQGQFIRSLSQWFEEANRSFFDFKLRPPTFRLASPRSTKDFGEYHNGDMIIRVSLFTGDHPQVMPGEEFAAGRLLLVRDIMLHLMVHQVLIELKGIDERNYDGHGPTFRDHCNGIGTTFGLPPVRASKSHKKVRHIPSCAVWPWGVRPEGYYEGAFTPRVPVRRRSAVAGIVERIMMMSLDKKRELRGILADKNLL